MKTMYFSLTLLYFTPHYTILQIFFILPIVKSYQNHQNDLKLKTIKIQKIP
uniref:Uncharacterized protein n=1 Tax=Myoviridae sp. ctdNl2 TaxID=2825140 RepID=A0A8S5QHB6_9CAUD|nr:MAG TPA: hypothetical protein [Myoviridae sp. ctdNl2]DAU66663.1 MAG TPA: hypothetical protein [Caudoviricetes sp.]